MSNQVTSPQYAAGFFDGEGCVYVRRIQAPSNYKGRTYYRVEATVGNCNKDVLCTLKNTFGGSIYEVNKLRVAEKDWSRQYRWALSSSAAAIPFLEAIYPYCIIKKPYVELALKFAVLVGSGRNRDEQAQAALYDEYRKMRSVETRTRHFPK